jgi:hypothetical protein
MPGTIKLKQAPVRDHPKPFNLQILSAPAASLGGGCSQKHSNSDALQGVGISHFLYAWSCLPGSAPSA